MSLSISSVEDGFPLQPEDRKMIRRKMRIGHIFSILVFLTSIAFAGYQYFQNYFPHKIIYYIPLGGLILSIIVNIIINFRFRKDLRHNTKYYIIQEVSDKFEDQNNAGFFNIDSEIIFIEDSIFHSVEPNDMVKVFYSSSSKTLLHIGKI